MARNSDNDAHARERRLIARARAGEEAALRELIEAHQDRLYAFIRRMVHHHHDAEEVCQEAFLKAFASLKSFSPQYRFSTWLFTIAYRVALNHLRRKKAVTGDVDFARLPQLESTSAASLVESAETARLRGKVWEMVDRLSPPQRAALVLFYRHEYSCQDIARILDVPVATVKSHLHRARHRLRDLLLEEVRDGGAVDRNISALGG